MLIGIAYYIFGSVWIIEICNSFGQFLCSFAVVSWYYMEKTDGVKEEAPPFPSFHGSLEAIKFHIGSLFLGASIIPWVRIPRVIFFFFCENCCGCCKNLINCGCCDKTDGCVWKYQKNAYTDIIIRSNNFLPAVQRAALIINSDRSSRKHNMICQIITVIGNVTIGTVCAGFTYLIVTKVDMYTNPTGSSYIYDPMAVSFLAFCLCACIAYGFNLIYDHTADTLLYCYAWSKKYKRDSVDRFCPDALRAVVGYDDKHADRFPYYGKAPAPMYLSSWLPTKKAEKNEKKLDGAKFGTQQGNSAYFGTGANPNISTQAPGYYDQQYNTGGYNTQGYPTYPEYNNAESQRLLP